MPKIFISYRRDDSAYVTDSIYTLLVGHFGKESVFLDVGSIPFGVDFRVHLRDQIAAHDVVLVVIGPHWAKLMQERASLPNDFARIEIENALSQGKLVIPVLVMNAEMPDFGVLPPSIQDLQWRNNATIRRQPDLEHDCERLAENIKNYFGITQPATSAPPKLSLHDQPPAQSPSIQTALQRARRFSGKHNRDWEPYVTPFADLPISDMPFCLVPVGSFRMGSGDGYYSNELPVCPQTIKQPYWIGQYPVTNAQWKRAVDAGVVQQPIATGRSRRLFNDPAMNSAPVVGVNWFMARDFAAWMGCRLPTELEWEYAARGVDSLRYPWGNDWKPDIPIWSGNSNGQPESVMIRPEGKSWVAAYHMIGNVWEWTNSVYKPYPYDETDRGEPDAAKAYVLRGGSWMHTDKDFLRAACRSDGNPTDAVSFGGFRLIRSVE